MRGDGRIVGGEGWQEKVHNREEWKKLLRTARNRHILHMPMEWNWMNEVLNNLRHGAEFLLRSWNCIYPYIRYLLHNLQFSEKYLCRMYFTLCTVRRWPWVFLMMELGKIFVTCLSKISQPSLEPKCYFYHPEPKKPVYTLLSSFFNPLNAELNPICHLLALLGGSSYSTHWQDKG